MYTVVWIISNTRLTKRVVHGTRNLISSRDHLRKTQMKQIFVELLQKNVKLPLGKPKLKSHSLTITTEKLQYEDSRPNLWWRELCLAWWTILLPKFGDSFTKENWSLVLSSAQVKIFCKTFPKVKNKTFPKLLEITFSEMWPIHIFHMFVKIYAI